tara:strand:- start:132 stop:470 length:339 start_codon:yes stop_codon:yes gene_type:complete
MPKSLANLIDEKFGTPTRPNDNPLITSVGAASERVLPQNPNRVAFTITNLSTGDVFLGLDNEVSSTRGFFIGPLGGSATVVWDEDFHRVGYEWWVIGSGAGLDIFTQEIVTT